MATQEKKKFDLTERCTQLNLRVIREVDALSQKRASWVIADQVLRSIFSIGANMSEAKGSRSRQEFARYYEIALKSANESVYWLETLQRTDLIGSSRIIDNLDEVHQLARILTASLKKLRASSA